MIKRYAVRYRTALVIGLALLSLFAFTMYRFYKSSQGAAERVMAKDIAQIVTILEKIDTTCEIVDIVRGNAVIDFLQIQAFAGSQIGSLQLRNPKKWSGPYMTHNPSMQGILYEIIQTTEGFYVVPGKGVKLSNGKVIGKDIIFTRDTDVEMYLNAVWGLEIDGEPLARKIELKHLLTKKFAPLVNTPDLD